MLPFAFAMARISSASSLRPREMSHLGLSGMKSRIMKHQREGAAWRREGMRQAHVVERVWVLWRC